MSHRNLQLLSSFLGAPLNNGIGRYICQLQRITIKFCKEHGASKGVRDFIEKDLVDFARENPGIVVYLKPRRHRSPVFSAEYLNGNTQWMSLYDFTREEVVQWLEHMRTRSGVNIVRLRKRWHTDCPSIQGVWMPYTWMPPEVNHVSFPNKELSSYESQEKSATEILKEMLSRQQVNLEKVEQDFPQQEDNSKGSMS